jgi:FkbM family methyltransferase
MPLRKIVKARLQQTGLFPAVRLAYRRLNPEIRAQRGREIGFYSEIIEPGSLVFDVGANLGQKSDVFLAAGLNVLILEPNRNCEKSLRLQFEGNPKATIDMRAVGSDRGLLDLYAVSTESTASFRSDWHRKVYVNDQACAPQLVEVTTLDDLIKQYGRPYFVKIDVEGFEAEVLRGLTAPVPLLSFEFLSDNIPQIETCLAQLSALAPISIRASSMDCEWLTPRTSDLSACLGIIESSQAFGDLFVWSD